MWRKVQGVQLYYANCQSDESDSLHAFCEQKKTPQSFSKNK